MANTATVTEGRATLQVPIREDARTKGPGKIEGGLFFNPAMRFNRDLSILFLEERAEAKESERAYEVFDGLAATGARSVRIALECRPRGRPVLVHANDRDSAAAKILRKNVEQNGVQDQVRVTEDDFIHALGTYHYDHVDVDPYGSPIPFLDAALRHTTNRGTVALTATDVTALCGVYPKVALRRYDAVPWHGPAMHEVALRILAGTAARTAARHDLAFTPLLAHATDHYIRVYGSLRRGAQRADANLDNIGHAVELADGTRILVPRGAERPADAPRFAGPLWIGPLQDKDLVARLLDRLGHHPEVDRPPVERFLQRAYDEADAPPLHYEIGETARRLKASAPPLAALLDALRQAGHQAARTHVADDAFKTDAPAHVIEAAFRGATRR